MRQKRKIVKDVTVDSCRIVTWILVASETSRTYRVSRIGVSCYINNVKKLSGHAVHWFKKPVSISKSNPCLDKYDYTHALNDARREAYMEYLGTLKSLTGRVQWFDKSRGDGSIYCTEIDSYFRVYACNLAGKRTWYAETACVYLDEGQEVTIDKLARVDTGLTPIISQGVKFDAEKWDTLKDKDLAFRCDDSGNVISGLFK